MTEYGPLSEKTDAQVEEEYKYWEEKIKNATAWGASLSAAAEFREDALRELKRRKSALKTDDELREEFNYWNKEVKKAEDHIRVMSVEGTFENTALQKIVERACSIYKETLVFAEEKRESVLQELTKRGVPV